MAKRGRPRSPVRPHIVYVKLRLCPGPDDDLIAFFDSIPPGLRAAMAKAALRSGTETSEKEDSWEQNELFDVLDSFVEG